MCKGDFYRACITFIKTFCRKILQCSIYTTEKKKEKHSTKTNNEIPLYIYLNGQNPEHWQHQMLTRMWNNRNSHSVASGNEKWYSSFGRLCGSFLQNYTYSYWDRMGPGTWDPLLQCLHPDKDLLEQQNTKKLQGTKNNCGHVQSG